MCVICVQWIADDQERLKNPFIIARDREKLGRDLHRYESEIQTWKQDITRIDADLRNRMSTLQGESCPKGNTV